MALYLDRASGTYEYRVYSSRDSTSAMALPRSFSSPTRAPSTKLSSAGGGNIVATRPPPGQPKGLGLIFSIPARPLASCEHTGVWGNGGTELIVMGAPHHLRGNRP